MYATLYPLMTAPADITFETRGRRTILLVECKSSPDDSAFHLWKLGAARNALPDGSADAMPVLHAYLGSIARQSPWAHRESLKRAVSWWLWDIAAVRRGPERTAADQMLSEFGLYELMKGGDTQLDTDP